MHSIVTSGNGQGGELVFGNRESSTVVRRDPQIIPGGRLQVQDHKISTGLHIIRDLIPLRLIPEIRNEN